MVIAEKGSTLVLLAMAIAYVKWPIVV